MYVSIDPEMKILWNKWLYTWKCTVEWQFFSQNLYFCSMLLCLHCSKFSFTVERDSSIHFLHLTCIVSRTWISSLIRFKFCWSMCKTRVFSIFFIWLKQILRCIPIDWWGARGLDLGEVCLFSKENKVIRRGLKMCTRY